MQVRPWRATETKAPLRAAITPASAPTMADGESMMTWSNLPSSSWISRPNAGDSSNSSGLGGATPTGSTNRLGRSVTGASTRADRRPARMLLRPARIVDAEHLVQARRAHVASISSVRRPSWLNAMARLAATKVLPSPAVRADHGERASLRVLLRRAGSTGCGCCGRSRRRWRTAWWP